MCDTAWFDLYLDLNPKDRKRRDLIVKHATAKGGDTEAFLRHTFPRYWGMVESADNAANLTPEREIEILTEMAGVPGPSMRVPGEQSGIRARTMPDHVPHIG